MTITNQFDFKGNYIDPDGETHLMTIFTTNYFLTNLRHRYFNRELFIDTDAPDTDLLNIFTSWMQSRGALYAKQAYAYTLAYNPIENYRRNETESIESSKTEQHSGNDTTSHTGTESSTSSNTNTATGSDSGTIDHKVTGYDSNTLVQQSQDSTTGTSNSQDTQSGTSAVTHNTQDQLSHGEKIEHSGDDDRTLLAYGNIGVTTSQEMLEQEMQIAPKLNTISAIVDSFIKRFCILVY